MLSDPLLPWSAAKERLRPWYLRNIYFRLFPQRKPPYFEKAWKFPHLPLTSLGGKSDFVPSLTGDPARNFFFFPLSDMHFRVQRPHFLMRELSAIGHRCFFLNPHLGRQFMNSGDTAPRISRISPNVFEIHIRLPLEPVYHHRLLHAGESRAIAAVIADLQTRTGAGQLVQVVASPVWRKAAELIREASGSPVIYDCHDLIAGFQSTHPAIAAAEANLVSAADLVVCTSHSLRDHCLKLGVHPDDCVIIRNGGLTDATIHRGSSAPGLSGYRIGYLGALDEWFDASSVRQAAIARPTWKFILAGRIETSKIAALERLSNVELTGEIPSEAVPNFLATLDVGTIPFLLNDLTRAVDPIKLYEYLGAGIPVVTARLPETDRFAPLLHYYDDAKNFESALQSALEDRTPERGAARRKAVAAETWSDRALQLASAVENLKRRTPIRP